MPQSTGLLLLFVIPATAGIQAISGQTAVNARAI
jgi:hypothetical protein